MNKLSSVLLFCALVAGIDMARADWVQVESENFHFLGDTDRDRALKIVADLEMYRASILAILGSDYFPEVRKVRIYGMRKPRSVNQVLGTSGILAAYVQGPDYPIIVTVVGGTSERVRSTVLHEYAHHVLGGLSSQYYPRWYNEGFAEYLASFSIDGDVISIGKPSSGFGRHLEQQGWIDINLMLSSVTNYPYDSPTNRVQAYRNNFFYGMSWLAVHYLQNTPELYKGFDTYIDLLNQGYDPLKAFSKGIGISPEEFSGRLREYWRADAFPVVQFRMTSELVRSKAVVSAVSEAEAGFSLMLARATFAPHDPEDEKQRAKIRRDIEKMLEEHGASAVGYQALMTLALRGEHYDAAVAAGEKLFSIAEDDPLAMQTLADALYHRYRDGGMRDIGDIARARTLFRSQLVLEPDNPTANSHYPQTLLLEKAPPDQLSLDAVAFNLRYRRSPIHTSTYLDGAEVLAAAGKPETACLLIGRVAGWVRALDAEMDEEERQRQIRFGRETELEKLHRLEASLGDTCSSAGA